MVYDVVSARGDCSQMSQRSTTLNTSITTTRAFVFFDTLVLSNRDISDELWSKRPLSWQKVKRYLVLVIISMENLDRHWEQRG